MAIASDIAELKERTLTLETTFEKLSEKQEDVAESVEDLQEDLKDLQARYEEELDKLEAFSRRDNLRFFGLTETPGETLSPDKMAILTKARPALKQKRIDVAGDLTQRQHEQIRLHRDKGVRAYYKGNKLVVAGPLQQRINDDTDNSSQRRFDISYNNNNSQA
nr:hypothetical protein BaRGS_014824 [Batillaria attramentaria]